MVFSMSWIMPYVLSALGNSGLRETPPSWSLVNPSRVRLDVPCLLYTGITLLLENVCNPSKIFGKDTNVPRFNSSYRGGLLTKRLHYITTS